MGCTMNEQFPHKKLYRVYFFPHKPVSQCKINLVQYRPIVQFYAILNVFLQLYFGADRDVR